MNVKQLILIAVFAISIFKLNAQVVSYPDFQKHYKPHYETTIDKSEKEMWKIIKTLNETPAKDLAATILALLDDPTDNNMLILARVLTNCDRKHIAKTLESMTLSEAVSVIKKMNNDWHKELVYFLNNIAYNKIAPALDGIRNFKVDGDFTSLEEVLNKDLPQKINTDYSELLPVVSPDGKKIFFARDNDPRNNYGEAESQDIWVADISNGFENAKAEHLHHPFNQGKFNSVVGVSPDGKTMLINGNYKNGIYQGRGYSIIRQTTTGYSEPEGLNIKNYTEYSKGKYAGAFLAGDMKTLLMYMSPEGSDNNNDLFVSFKNADGSWTEPKSLGSKINNNSTQISPFLASDRKTLYYSTNQDGGKGSNDIWITKRLDDSWTNWSEPKNLGDNINTPGWDAYYTVDASGEYAYMVSDKNSDNENIIRIKLEKEDQPEPVVLVRGHVFDEKTKKPLQAEIEYIGLDDGKQYGTTYSDPNDGSYTIILPYGKNYSFNANTPNFIAISDNINLTEIGTYQEIKRDLYIVPIEVGAKVRLNSIFFEKNKATLKASSYIELDRVIEVMKNNPSLKIEISGHTDNVGNKDYNLTLSQERAKSVLNYLQGKGISIDRLKSKGYGMSSPIESNDTEEGKAKNRRVEFLILEK